MAEANAPSSVIQLIVGLGNPGVEHQDDRHNAGFWWLDQLVDSVGGTWRAESKFQAQVARIDLADRQIWCLKPQTYMNHSGRAVSAFCQFYKLSPQAKWVVYDELDLPPGVARLKWAGGHGGHNGVRDIIAAAGGANFWRLRLGIGHPGQPSRVSGYVLSRPSRSDQGLIERAMGEALSLCSLFLRGDAAAAMKALHTTD